MLMPSLNSFFGKMLSYKLKRIDWLSLFLIAGVFLYLLFIGPIQAPDSWGYLQTNILRSPGYPLFLKLIQFVSKSHKETLLVVIQLLLGVWAVLLTAKTLQKLFDLNKTFFILFISILLTPYLGKAGNYILTEGLAYPLFLFSVNYLLVGLIYQNNRDLGFHLICLTALVLTRGQFLFMYGVTFLGLLFSFQYNRTLKKRILLILLLIGSWLSSNMLDKAYHAWYHDIFTATPFTGVHLCIQPLYVAHLEDVHLFSDLSERNFFLEVRQQMEEKRMSYPFAAGHIDPPYHFYAHFNEILYSIVYPALSHQGFNNAVEVESRLKKMAIKLMINRPIDYLKLYVRNTVGILGGYYNALTLLFGFIMSSFYYLRYRHPLSICLSLCSLMAIGNGLLVACVQPALARYTFYTNAIGCCLLLVIFHKGLECLKKQ